MNFTTDLWSSVTCDNYLAITCHWVNASWKMRRIVLDFVDVESKQDGESTCNFIFQTIRKFNLESKVLCITTDNCAAMVCAMNNLINKMKDKHDVSIIHFRCTAHILNLIVVILYHSETFNHSICNIRDICKLARSSSRNVLKLKNYAQSNGEKDNKIILDSETRWNSTFDMLNSVLKLKESLTDFAQTESQKKLTSDDWKAVLVVVDILQPFKSATLEICGDKDVFISKLYPVFNEIKDHLNDCLKKPKFAEYKLVLQNMISKYDEYWCHIKHISIFANGLDPRFKLDAMSRDDKKYFENQIEHLFVQYKIASPSSCQSSNTSSQKQDESSLIEKALMKKKLLSSSSNQFANYTSSPRASIYTDPLNWWIENQTVFPVLSKIAGDFLASQP